jgi:hypothetical protein
MATSQKFLPFDNSSVANFILWGQGISDRFAEFGWVQQPDTGQVVWVATVLTLTQVTVGANAVYSYSSYTGPAPRVGMSVIITGFATGGNNVTATLTAVSGGASGTVTVALTTQSNETHAGSGTTTAIASVPVSAYAYEIWAPGDALQTGATAYYFKMEYGFSATIMGMRVQLGTGTNGAGTLTGSTTTAITFPTSGTATMGGAVTFECDFSGDAGRFGCILWRNNTFSTGIWPFFIERTLATDGTPSSLGVTVVGLTGIIAAGLSYKQQTIVFGVGAANQILQPCVLTAVAGATLTDTFNNNIAISPVFPDIGYFLNPMTVCGAMRASDIGEGGILSTTLYGATRLYLCSNSGGWLTQMSAETQAGGRLMMRYD